MEQTRQVQRDLITLIYDISEDGQAKDIQLKSLAKLSLLWMYDEVWYNEHFTRVYVFRMGLCKLSVKHCEKDITKILFQRLNSPFFNKVVFIMHLFNMYQFFNHTFVISVTTNETIRDYCVTNPCINRGVCISGDGRYICNCTAGWTGDNCHLGKEYIHSYTLCSICKHDYHLPVIEI